MTPYKQEHLVIGVDFGTDSVRAIIADAADGTEIASSVFAYPRWAKGLYCDPAQNRFRQHPQDYILGLETTIRECLRKAGGAAANKVRAISIDTTGSTPVAVNEQGTPLALTPGFEKNPNAMFVLWKDHTAISEAAEINRLAANFPNNYLKYAGGIYSSEWYWAKALHILRADETIRNACYTWVEHCDWIPFLLTGGNSVKQLKRSRCAAGHKALWSADWDGFPPVHWFSILDPLLEKQAFRLPRETYTADQPAGTLCTEWAQKLGLNTGVIIGCGAFDAHMGAVGGQIAPYYLSKVMGTSTCDILVVPPGKQDVLVKGICGQVDGSVIPGMTGYEAGQSAFGDTYAWFKKLLEWPLQFLESDTLKQHVSEQILSELSRQAAALPPDEEAEIALDWLNGRRTPDADQQLKATLSGLSLGSDAPRIFRSLAEATCFGARAIVERFQTEGIPIQGIIGIGGVTRKSPYIMQLMADVLQMPISIHRSEQTCALGAAMFAATAAGLHPSVNDAMQAMGQGFDLVYHPDLSKAGFYDRRYRKYQRLGYFTEEDVHELS
jgi:L-ribulokinase